MLRVSDGIPLPLVGGLRTKVIAGMVGGEAGLLNDDMIAGRTGLMIKTPL
jgi:hypothetical protein